MEKAPILIVGGGLAGVFCALKLAPLPVTILSSANVGESGSSFWAQGGVAAAVTEEDAPEVHAFDTIRAGAGIVDRDVALNVALEARDRVDDLAAMGAPFDRDGAGLLQPSREAAHSHRRIVRVKGDGAGRAIMQTLARQVAATPSITVLEGVTVTDILMREGRAAGVVGVDAAGAPRVIACGALVLATGGVGHLYRVTTNPIDACGAGVGMAARVGATIADPEFVQFHPTAISIGVDPAPLATESLRGEGALIVDRNGERFLTSIDPAAELAPRDIVARAVFASLRDGKGAFLDARAAIGADFPTRFPAVYASCMAAGIDPITMLVPIAPAAHYHMGGVATDARGRTSVPALWAAGEVACTGLHGANRLASNSLLEAIVFGARVAKDIAAAAPEATELPDPPLAASNAASPPTDDECLRDAMSDYVGVIRDENGLREAMRIVMRLRSEPHDAASANRLTTALLIVAAAFSRRESRGAHFRSDFPNVSTTAQRTKLTLREAEDIARAAVRA